MINRDFYQVSSKKRKKKKRKKFYPNAMGKSMLWIYNIFLHDDIFNKCLMTFKWHAITFNWRHGGKKYKRDTFQIIKKVFNTDI